MVSHYWYAGWYFGFFTDIRLMTMWQEVQYEVEKTLLIEQIYEKAYFHLKRTSLDATASVGIFLQIGRWEKRIKKSL